MTSVFWNTFSKSVRLTLLFLLGVMLAGSLFACRRQGVESASSLEPSDCQWIEHAAGRTCVPHQIERLVTLDTVSFENAIALGLQPIATVDTQRIDDLLKSQLSGVVDIGESEAPNLEQVLQLKPDFILGLDGASEGLYTQASQIAPTAMIAFDYSGQWKEVFFKYAQVLNREDVGKQVMDEYDARSQTFQQQLAAQFPSEEPPQISVVRIYPATINLYFRESFPGIVLADAGLARPEAQDITATEARSLYQNPIQAAISLERLDFADGNAIFVWTAEGTEEADRTAQEKLAVLEADPLWQNLKAVQANRVYFVPNYWIGSGPIAANAILDDLFKYLIEEA